MRRSIVWLAVTSLLGACSFAPSPTPMTQSQELAATAHLSLGNIELDYPVDWTVYDQGWATLGFGQPLAIIGTLPWGPCVASDINCHYQQRLDPGQITVQIGAVSLLDQDICELGATRSDLAGRGPGDPPATGSLTRVDGRPTIRTDYAVNQTDYYHSDEWRDWLIAAPDSNAGGFTINAMYRGPGLDALRAELDQLVASIRFGPAWGPRDPSKTADCGAPFPG